MFIANVISRSWRDFLAVFKRDDQKTLLETLCDVYRAEVSAIAQCTQHAAQMHYPQFRAELLRIAAEMQEPLPWLRQQILALGGHMSSSSPMLTRERNSWECLRRDVEEARRGRARLLEWTHRIEREEPAIAVGLQRIRENKLKHQEEFRLMFMKSDPYTIAATSHPQAQEAPQKQAWLEKRKNDWMDHERVEWENEGKQSSWAEWSGEQEFKWATELPHRNFEWAQRLAEQGSVTPFSSCG